MMPTSDSRPLPLSGYGFALLAAALWGLLGPVSRVCLADGVAPLEVAFWRALIGGLCFGLHGVLRHELRVPWRHGLIFCLFGVVGVGFFFSVYQIAVQESGAALAVVLLYTSPVWVAVFSRILFREILGGRKLAALAVALCGTTLVCFSGGSLGQSPSLWGIVCGLLAGFFYATHYPFYVWWQSRYATSTLYTYMLLAGAAFLLPFLPVSPLAVKSGSAWFALLVLGLLCTYGAYLAYGAALRRINPVRVAVVCNLEPVIGTLLAWAWWGELFPTSGWLGGTLVLVAVLLLTTDKRQ